jgi:hypothetical protein
MRSVTGADSLEVAAWRMAAGCLSLTELPEIAIDAIAAGHDSPSLVLLAGQPWFDVHDSADLFRAALTELGIELPDADSAWWQLIRRTAAGMVAGSITPRAGAIELQDAYYEVRDNEDLLIFLLLASELDDHPADAEPIEANMVAAARELLVRPAQRSGNDGH